VLSECSDAEVGGSLCQLLFQHHGPDIDASKLAEAEQVVLLICNASGYIGNGGFRYLFEANFPGDPNFERTKEAFEAIDSPHAAAGFRETFALFPSGRPPADRDERLAIYLKSLIKRLWSA